MNYLLSDKRGRRKGAHCATILHLSRILLFLRENSGYYTKSDIINNCEVPGYCMETAMKFLVKENFIVTTKTARLNGHNRDVVVYSIK